MKKMYIVAALCALICGFLVFTFFRNMQSDSQKADVVRVEVLMAVENIPALTELKEEMFVKKAVPAEGLRSDVVTSFDQIAGKVSSSSFVIGETLIQAKFDTEKITIPTYRIPEGMRVMTVTVGSDSGLANSLSAGDMVDVLFTAFTQSDDSQDQTINGLATGSSQQTDDSGKVELCEGIEVKKSVTSVLLESVEVFATGSALDAEGTAYSTVSLVLSPHDCQRLLAAQNYGAYTFVLRGHDDVEPVYPENVMADEILASQPEE